MGTSSIHGNILYGNKGIQGKLGADGASLYYTPYSLKTEHLEILSRISSGSSLSNNDNVVEYIEYKENDIIIDRNGNAGIIDSDLSITNIGKIIKNDEIQQQTEETCDASFLTSNDYYYIENEYNYIAGWNDSSYHILRNRDALSDKICVEYIALDSIVVSKIINYNPHFLMIFEDGFIVDFAIKPGEDIHIDSRYIYYRMYGNAAFGSVDNEFTYNATMSNSVQSYIRNKTRCYIEYSISGATYRVKINFTNQ